MNVIMIGHQKRQGKDTAADIIQKATGGRIIRFADAMKDIVADAFGISLEQLEYAKNSGRIKAFLKYRQLVFLVVDFRVFLQRFGSGQMKHHFGAKVWRDVVIREIQAYQMEGGTTVIIPDFRFPSEYIKGSFSINVTGRAESTDTHVSETAMNFYPYDYRIQNTGTLAELEAKVLEILEQADVYE